MVKFTKEDLLGRLSALGNQMRIKPQAICDDWLGQKRVNTLGKAILECVSLLRAIEEGNKETELELLEDIKKYGSDWEAAMVYWRMRGGSNGDGP